MLITQTSPSTFQCLKITNIGEWFIFEKCIQPLIIFHINNVFDCICIYCRELINLTDLLFVVLA